MFNHVPNTMQSDFEAIKMGLFGEVGELVDQVKKMMFKPGYERDVKKLWDELGDVGFYIAAYSYITAPEIEESPGLDPYTKSEILDTLWRHADNPQYRPSIADKTLEIQLKRLARVAADIYVGDCTSRIEAVDLLIDTWLVIADILKFDAKKVMADNAKKLAGGKHGWTDNTAK